MFKFRAIFSITIFLTIYHQNEANDIKETYIYPGKAKSERDLTTCKEREVCSIIHKRYWFPGQVERFCRCDRNECPSTWSEPLDNFTMGLNNRAQMKFCEPIIDLPNCIDNGTLYLHIQNQTNIQTTAENDNDFKITSKAECYCPEHHKWIPNSHQRNGTKLSITSFRCSKLDECNINDFCGMERADYFSIYYRCSCPLGHLCIRKDKTLYPVTEVFFSGGAYKAYCLNFPPIKNFTINKMIQKKKH